MDTLIYFGDLSQVFSGALARAAPRSDFIFSLEELQGGLETLDVNTDPTMGYLLERHGRFSLRETYVVDTLQANGWNALAVNRTVLRYEGPSPVHSLLVHAQRA